MRVQFKVAEACAWTISAGVHLGLGWALMNQAAPEMAAASAPYPAAMQVMLFDARISRVTAAASIASPAAAPLAVNPVPAEIASPEPGASPPPSASTVAGGSAGTEAAAPGPASAADLDAFQHRLLAHIARFKAWPAGGALPARPALVRFVLKRDGTVAGMWIYSSSGVERFDTAALETLSRAQPLPTPPAGLPDPLNVMLPVTFERSGG